MFAVVPCHCLHMSVFLVRVGTNAASGVRLKIHLKVELNLFSLRGSFGLSADFCPLPLLEQPLTNFQMVLLLGIIEQLWDELGSLPQLHILHKNLEHSSNRQSTLSTNHTQQKGDCHSQPDPSQSECSAQTVPHVFWKPL